MDEDSFYKNVGLRAVFSSSFTNDDDDDDDDVRDGDKRRPRTDATAMAKKATRTTMTKKTAKGQRTAAAADAASADAAAAAAAPRSNAPSSSPFHVRMSSLSLLSSSSSLSSLQSSWFRFSDAIPLSLPRHSGSRRRLTRRRRSRRRSSARTATTAAATATAGESTAVDPGADADAAAGGGGGGGGGRKRAGKGWAHLPASSTSAAANVSPALPPPPPSLHLHSRQPSIARRSSFARLVRSAAYRLYELEAFLRMEDDGSSNARSGGNDSAGAQGSGGGGGGGAGGGNGCGGANEYDDCDYDYDDDDDDDDKKYDSLRDELDLFGRCTEAAVLARRRTRTATDPDEGKRALQPGDGTSVGAQPNDTQARNENKQKVEVAGEDIDYWIDEWGRRNKREQKGVGEISAEPISQTQRETAASVTKAAAAAGTPFFSSFFFDDEDNDAGRVGSSHTTSATISGSNMFDATRKRSERDKTNNGQTRHGASRIGAGVGDAMPVSPQPRIANIMTKNIDRYYDRDDEDEWIIGGRDGDLNDDGNGDDDDDDDDDDKYDDNEHDHNDKERREGACLSSVRVFQPARRRVDRIIGGDSKATKPTRSRYREGEGRKAAAAAAAGGGGTSLKNHVRAKHNYAEDHDHKGNDDGRGRNRGRSRGRNIHRESMNHDGTHTPIVAVSAAGARPVPSRFYPSSCFEADPPPPPPPSTGRARPAFVSSTLASFSSSSSSLSSASSSSLSTAAASAAPPSTFLSRRPSIVRDRSRRRPLGDRMEKEDENEEKEEEEDVASMVDDESMLQELRHLSDIEKVMRTELNVPAVSSLDDGDGRGGMKWMVRGAEKEKEVRVMSRGGGGGYGATAVARFSSTPRSGEERAIGERTYDNDDEEEEQRSPNQHGPMLGPRPFGLSNSSFSSFSSSFSSSSESTLNLAGLEEFVSQLESEWKEATKLEKEMFGGEGKEVKVKTKTKSNAKAKAKAKARNAERKRNRTTAADADGAAGVVRAQRVERHDRRPAEDTVMIKKKDKEEVCQDNDDERWTDGGMERVCRAVDDGGRRRRIGDSLPSRPSPGWRQAQRRTYLKMSTIESIRQDESIRSPLDEKKVKTIGMDAFSTTKTTILAEATPMTPSPAGALLHLPDLIETAQSRVGTSGTHGGTLTRTARVERGRTSPLHRIKDAAEHPCAVGLAIPLALRLAGAMAEAMYGRVEAGAPFVASGRSKDVGGKDISFATAASISFHSRRSGDSGDEFSSSSSSLPLSKPSSIQGAIILRSTLTCLLLRLLEDMGKTIPGLIRSAMGEGCEEVVAPLSDFVLLALLAATFAAVLASLVERCLPNGVEDVHVAAVLAIAVCIAERAAAEMSEEPTFFSLRDKLL